MAGHYRHFIKNYARIASPLTDYLKGDGSKKKKEGVVLNKKVVEAFNTLKHSVLSAPILVYPDPKKEYLLKADASMFGPRCSPVATSIRRQVPSCCLWELYLAAGRDEIPLNHEMGHHTFQPLSHGKEAQSEDRQ